MGYGCIVLKCVEVISTSRCSALVVLMAYIPEIVQERVPKDQVLAPTTLWTQCSPWLFGPLGPLELLRLHVPRGCHGPLGTHQIPKPHRPILFLHLMNSCTARSQLNWLTSGPHEHPGPHWPNGLSHLQGSATSTSDGILFLVDC